MIENISRIIINQCESEITLIFNEYLTSNIFTEKDAEIYFKLFDSNEEKKSINIIHNNNFY